MAQLELPEHPFRSPRSVSSLAKFAGVSRRTVQRYIQRGLMAKDKAGRISYLQFVDARSRVLAEAKNRGWKICRKRAQKSLGLRRRKNPAEPGYYRGRTMEQRVEIVIRELMAIGKDPRAILTVSQWVAKNLAADLGEMVAHADRKMEELSKKAEHFQLAALLKLVSEGPSGESPSH